MANETTEAWAWFMDQLVAMEPDTENSGTYAKKRGYHGRRRDQPRDDYSVQHPLDKMGPDDKSAAGDWTHRAAQRGDYRSMAKYGMRLEKAWRERDPRLFGWVEAQGQTDVDAAPEELNFGPLWNRAVPSKTHSWHWHLAERRKFVESWDNKRCMLSILKGETLAGYLAGGGKLMGDDMSWEQNLSNGKVTYPAKDWMTGISGAVWDHIVPALAAQAKVLEAIAKKVDLDDSELEALKASAEAGAKAGAMAAVPGLVAAVAETLRDQVGLTQAEAEEAAERAMRSVLGQLDNGTVKTT